ncbi:MAG TPA: hypothetical protein VG778_12540, partial [Blastocatellia bacterium]|nr:hypothetical protein [Blastocatellia bacterium]
IQGDRTLQVDTPSAGVLSAFLSVPRRTASGRTGGRVACDSGSRLLVNRVQECQRRHSAASSTDWQRKRREEKLNNKLSGTVANLRKSGLATAEFVLPEAD